MAREIQMRPLDCFRLDENNEDWRTTAARQILKHANFTHKHTISEHRHQLMQAVGFSEGLGFSRRSMQKTPWKRAQTSRHERFAQAGKARRGRETATPVLGEAIMARAFPALALRGGFVENL
jgi:hypothetical protein